MNDSWNGSEIRRKNRRVCKDGIQKCKRNGMMSSIDEALQKQSVVEEKIEIERMKLRWMIWFEISRKNWNDLWEKTEENWFRLEGNDKTKEFDLWNLDEETKPWELKVSRNWKPKTSDSIRSLKSYQMKNVEEFDIEKEERCRFELIDTDWRSVGGSKSWKKKLSFDVGFERGAIINRYERAKKCEMKWKWKCEKKP